MCVGWCHYVVCLFLLYYNYTINRNDSNKNLLVNKLRARYDAKNEFIKLKWIRRCDSVMTSVPNLGTASLLVFYCL